MAEHADVIGWDVGGAHVKACLMRRGEVVDVMLWACPLWQGIEHLAAVLRAAHARWPGMAAAQHAVTMTGEMADLFATREDGVRRIAAEMHRGVLTAPGSPPARAAGSVHFFAGDAGWCSAAEAASQWPAVASANWLATARHAALGLAGHDANGGAEGVVIDIGSTTTDLIAFRDGRPLTRSRSDAERLAGGELAYHGVVRTPLCAIAHRIAWRGTPHNVMNEFFATAADVYRLTGELDPAHDLHPAADGAAKDLPATRQRLARMIGLDARDAPAADWLAFARAWRGAQIALLGAELRRVIAEHGLGPAAVIVSAGCGAFLVADVLAHAAAPDAAPHRLVGYGDGVARIAPRAADRAADRTVALAADRAADRAALQRWAQVCAPCVAVAALCDMELR